MAVTFSSECRVPPLVTRRNAQVANRQVVRRSAEFRESEWSGIPRPGLQPRSPVRLASVLAFLPPCRLRVQFVSSAIHPPQVRAGRRFPVVTRFRGNLLCCQPRYLRTYQFLILGSTGFPGCFSAQRQTGPFTTSPAAAPAVKPPIAPGTAPTPPAPVPTIPPATAPAEALTNVIASSHGVSWPPATAVHSWSSSTLMIYLLVVDEICSAALAPLRVTESGATE